jgi:hypothetical protein
VLDYHLSNLEHKNLEVVESTQQQMNGLIIKLSDHKMVKVTLLMVKVDKKIELLCQDKLARNLGSKGAIKVMMDREWPEKPFILVAK